MSAFSLLPPHFYNPAYAPADPSMSHADVSSSQRPQLRVMSTGITGLFVVYGQNSLPPEGFIKIPVDLNNGAGGEYVYLCYTTGAGDPINFIQVFAGDSEDFEIQNGYNKLPYDLNKGAGGKYIYLCYTKVEVARPVMDLNVVQGSSPHVYPTSEWIRINQDCSEGAGGDYTYIVFKYWIISSSQL